MSVRSGQSITVLFTTRVFATGVGTNADSLPTGTLYLNGTANGATVTVTNISTGLYKAAVTLPTLAVSDEVEIIIAATVSTIADTAVIWGDTKDVFAGAIPDVIAGGAGGLFIAGTNAATTITTGLTTTFTGNLTGSVGSVTGAVGSVTGNVGGSVGSVTGAVGSVTAGVTVTTNNDKTGYSLTQSFPSNFSSLAITAGGAVTIGTVNGTASNIKKNQALANFEFVMRNSTTHIPQTGLTVTATRNIDNAGFGACANAVSEVANGWYVINLAATDLNGNVIAFRMTATSADDLDFTLITQP